MAQYRREKNVGFLGQEDGEGGGRETESRVQSVRQLEVHSHSAQIVEMEIHWEKIQRIKILDLNL